jgi:hypothetical protein
MAQVPQGVGYQGVATDANGIELVNQSISIRASVLSGSATGTVEWEETHATSTDTFGLFTLTIGQGTNTTNGLQTSFADISWGTNTHFLKIEMDVTGGSTYSNMGTNQMMSVPYALYAESANINYDSISNLLSNDSTFITNVGGGMGGGCDMKFPDGINGEAITEQISTSLSYTVPIGKTLYITNLYLNPQADLQIDNKIIADYYFNNSSYSNVLAQPIIIKSNSVLSSDGNNVLINGFLVNENVDVISTSLSNSINYTVPIGKTLYITNLYLNALADLQIDNKIIADYYFNNGSYGNVLAQPIIIKSNSVLSSDGNNVQINGYLVDENYFAGCGGGSSSISNNIPSIIYTIDGF